MANSYFGYFPSSYLGRTFIQASPRFEEIQHLVEYWTFCAISCTSLVVDYCILAVFVFHSLL